MWGGFFTIPPKKMFGFDCSHHQGTIDWHIVATQNSPKVDFAYIKASTGVGSADPRALFNATEAKKNGIKVGYYHYCSLNDKNEVYDATQEAAWFHKVLSKLPTSDLPVVLDIEDNNPTVHLQPGQVLNFINVFFSNLKSYGIIDHVLYSYTYFLNSHLPANHGLTGTKLWIADYTAPLILPKGWNSAWLWQYTDKGTIKGVHTPVDLNKQ